MQMMKVVAIAAIVAIVVASASHAAGAPSHGSRGFGVGPQYDTTHVYVAPEDFDRFVASFVATFGGSTSKQGVFMVTPTPSSTMSQLVLTPAGTLVDRKLIGISSGLWGAGGST